MLCTRKPAPKNERSVDVYREQPKGFVAKTYADEMRELTDASADAYIKAEIKKAASAGVKYVYFNGYVPESTVKWLRDEKFEVEHLPERKFTSVTW